MVSSGAMSAVLCSFRSALLASLSVLIVLVAVALASAQTPGGDTRAEAPPALGAAPVLDAALRAADQVVRVPQPADRHGQRHRSPESPPIGGNIDYRGLLADTFTDVTIQHAARIATESRTREALKGPFWDDYVHALSIWRGWGDRDTTRVNYFGHPAMGLVSAFIFANNDLVSQATSFGQPGYGRAKWRQFLFANVYSLQFEVGPCSKCGDRERRPGHRGPHHDAGGRHGVVVRRGHHRREVAGKAAPQPQELGERTRAVCHTNALARKHRGVQVAVVSAAAGRRLTAPVPHRAHANRKSSNAASTTA